MKLSLYVASAFVGLFLGSIAGIASASVPTAAPIVDDAPLVIELPAEPPVVRLPQMVIVGRVPVRSIAARTWTCTAPQAMLQGPASATVRTCGWR
jgi:hypothetical protein